MAVVMSQVSRMTQECPECREGTPLVEDYAAGDLICTACGLVLEGRSIDEGSEWRTFTNEQPNTDPVRVGGPSNPLLSDGGLTTVISKTGGAAAASLARLQAQQHNPDKQLIYHFKQISAMADRLNLVSTVKDRAHEIYKQVDDIKALKSRPTEAVLAACLYMACRQEDMPRTFKEICAVALTTNKKDIGRCYKLIASKLEQSMGTIHAEDYLRRFGARLGLAPEAIRGAQAITDRAKTLGVGMQKSPVSIAAAVIYVTVQLTDTKRTVKEISAATGVAEVTIRGAYKNLHARISELVPDWFAKEADLAKLVPPREG